MYIAACDEPLQVSIYVSYTPPADFLLEHPYYRAASYLTLTCIANGLQVYLEYNWTSNCTGECFTQENTNQFMQEAILKSTDSGFHTCTVTDAENCTGNATIEIRVVGEGLYYVRSIHLKLATKV